MFFVSAGPAQADDQVPVPWNGIDIGELNPVGTARADSGVFTLTGGSGALAGTNDRFHFVYQSLTGDCVLTARVSAGANPAGLAAAGLMVRQALESGSDFVAVTLTPGQGVFSTYRTAYAPQTAEAESAGAASQVWVKLVKRADAAQGYMAADQDGTPGAWKKVGGRQPIPSGMIYVGLCLAGGAQSGAATFDHVSLTTGTQPVTGGGVYTLSPASAPGMVLTAAGGGVKLSVPDDSPGQQWRLAGGGGVYSLQPLSEPALALSVPGAKTGNGSPVAVAADEARNTQRWSIVAQSNGTYSLLPQFNAGIGLDDFGGNGTPDAVIDIWSYNSGDLHLQWKIDAVQ